MDILTGAHTPTSQLYLLVSTQPVEFTITFTRTKIYTKKTPNCLLGIISIRPVRCAVKELKCISIFRIPQTGCALYTRFDAIQPNRTVRVAILYRIL